MKNNYYTILLLLSAVSVALIYSVEGFAFMAKLASTFYVLIHESGHSIAALLVGYSVEEVVISSSGGHTLSEGVATSSIEAAFISLSGFFFTWMICFFILLSSAAKPRNVTLSMIVLAATVFLVSAFTVDAITAEVLILGSLLLFFAVFVINPLNYYVVHIFAFILLVEILSNDLKYIWLKSVEADAFQAAHHLDVSYNWLALTLTVIVIIGIVLTLKVWLATSFSLYGTRTKKIDV